MTRSKRFLFAISVLSTLALLISGCGLRAAGTESANSPVGAAERFLRAWQEKRYDDMYGMIATASQGEIARERFVQRYEAIAAEATIKSLSYTVSGAKSEGTDKAEVPAKVKIQTAFLGEIAQDNKIPVTKEGEWRIVWSPSLIFSQLGGDALIRLQTVTPKRGAILDRNGKPIATEGAIKTVGVVPGQIKDREGLVAAVARILSLDQAVVRAAISVPAQPNWFVPVQTLPAASATVIDQLRAIPGVVVRDEAARVYPGGSAAAHVTGYLTQVTADELPNLADQGYDETDWRGRDGVEQSLEEFLAGKKGGRLVTVSPDGVVQEVIAEKDAAAAADVYLTIDLGLQQKAAQLLAGRKGAIIALDPRDNTILAMASSPAYDPNAFVQGLSAAGWRQIADDPSHPMLNRATEGAYPPGSIFKAVVAAAGMEKGGFKPDSTFRCTPTWAGLGPDNVKNNWRPDDLGTVDLLTGLAESCNPVFYEVGKKLDEVDPNALPNFAKALGLGRPTGIAGLDETAGLVPSPDWKRSTRNQPWYAGDTVNMSIGQGDLMLTPLQVANLYSTIASGNLRTPVIVGKVVQGDRELRRYVAEKSGELPMSPDTLKAIRQGMYQVINDPRGTGYLVFQGVPFKAAGKSGSAEDAGVNSHAWFLAFAPFEQPRILVLALLEEGGWGSEHAGPLVRQMLEYYFSTSPAR